MLFTDMQMWTRLVTEQGMMGYLKDRTAALENDRIRGNPLNSVPYGFGQPQSGYRDNHEDGNC